jgi:hypothetical protein
MGKLYSAATGVFIAALTASAARADGPDISARLRLRGPSGAKDEFLLAATAQNLRKLAKFIPLPAPIFAT